MGITRETGTVSKNLSEPRKKTFKNQPNARTPGGFFSSRTKRPTSTAGEQKSSKSKSKMNITDKKSVLSAKGGNKKPKDGTARRKTKVPPVHRFGVGHVVDGVNQYNVKEHVGKSAKNPLDVDVYVVNDSESMEEYRMKIARLDTQILKVEAALLRKLEKTPDAKCFVSMTEYGTIPKDKVEFLIVSPYGATLHELMKKVANGQFTIDCAFNVGHQMLKAIKSLHSLGYVHRNIRPAAFNIGLSVDESQVMLQDFRAVRKFEKDKKHLAARPSVKPYGTGRFSSRACQNSKDQGRKDDLECWLYTMFYLMDNASLSWKKEANTAVVVGQKEAFMAGDGKNQFNRAPGDLKALVHAVAKLEFESAPDYDLFKNGLETIQLALKLNPRACDWSGTPGNENIGGDTDRSFDCKVTGEREALVRDGQKAKKPNRKKLSSGDVILGVGATAGWKVINLLGSGGFGDVYKVHRENQPDTKCYALKTESEEGEKRYLRLKIEVTVMMKTADKKKANLFKNFIEFVDRGKCEELKCKFVVMGLVGPSLEDIRRKYILCSFSKHTNFNVAIQTVTAIRDLHSIGYLHRDIKPANYAVGTGDTESTVYMLDFGIAKLYINENGDHKVKRKKVKFLGTLRYACRACMLQLEQGRKDDLETWIYMIFDLMDESNGMPWRRMSDAKEILKSKKEFFTEFDQLYVNRILKRFRDLVLYIDKMQYETTPDYDYILNFLKTTASDVNAKVTKKVDWLGKLNKKEFESESEKSDKKGSGDDDE